MMYKKGLTLLFAVMITVMLSPFSIYADTQIVPSLSSSAQTWVNNNGQVTVTNYCEGTTAATNSCKLTFSVPSNWYGMIYFDGYDSSNHLWIDYGTVFIADGIGEYNYNFWQSSQKVISKVTIQIINLVKPDSNVDLTQIIQLLTAIENDTSSIDLTLDNTLSQITNVLNQLIISNGYLETLSKMRQWHFPFESLGIIMPTFEYGFDQTGLIQYNDYDFPVFTVPSNRLIYRTYANSGYIYKWIFIVDKNYYNLNLVNQNFSITNGSISKFTFINRFYYNYDIRYILSLEVTASDTGFLSITYNGDSDMMYMPIYYNYIDNNNISTDFALRFGLSNSLLDNINLIANGTSASQSAAVDSQTANSQLETSSNQLFIQEDSFKSDMNNAMQNIPQFSINNFGNKFMTSATWVRQQYERMTNNTPFQQVITFSLLVGLSMILIGKVRK